MRFMAVLSENGGASLAQQLHKILNTPRDRPPETLAQRRSPLERHPEQVGFSRASHQIFVAGAELIDQPQVEASPRQPVLAGRHPGKIQAWTMRLDELLEEQVRVLQLLLELLPALLGDLPEDADRALELSGAHLLEVDVVLLQQAMHGGHLRAHADRPDDGAPGR